MCTSFVSIIIPAYNVALYIGKTLKTLEFQTLKNFEAIIINDGSTDNTIEVINNFKLHSNLVIKVVSQNNLGVSHSRNVGIDNSKGDFIIFLDGDDYAEREYVEKLYNNISRDDIDMAFCLYNKVDENGKILKGPPSHYYKMAPIIPSIKLIKMFLYDNKILWTGSVIYKSKILKQYKLRFTQHLKYSEDQEFTAKAIYHSKNIGFEKSILVNYVQRTNSAVNNPNHIRLREKIKAFNKLKKYFFSIKDRKIFLFIQNFKIPQNIGAVLTDYATLIDKRNYDRLVNRKVIKRYLLKGIFCKHTSLILIIKFTFLFLFPKLTYVLYLKKIIKK